MSTTWSKKNIPQRRTHSPRLRTSSRHSSEVSLVLLRSQPVGEDTWAKIADACARLAQAAAEEGQTMSRRELSELKKRWKAVEREASQGERYIKKMQVEVETLRKKADLTGWNKEKECASVEALRSAKNNANCSTQVRVSHVS
jgi:structural maintenance of chromosome 2